MMMTTTSHDGGVATAEVTGTSCDPLALPLNGKPYNFTETVATVADWLKVLHGDSPAVELRALKCIESNYRKPHTRCGFYDPAHLSEMAEAAITLSRDASPGVYMSLNPVNPDLLARRCNRQDVADDAATDADITRRKWLLIDIDPKRVSGVSATDEEKAHAFELALRIRRFLSAAGWPDPIIVDSGNGYHLFYWIDLPTDDGGMVERCLKALAAKFDTEAVTVDRTVFNPSRIVKIPGTLARKGDHTATRPWRRSKILGIPNAIEIVPVDLLESLAFCVPTGKVKTRQESTRQPVDDFGPADARTMARFRKYMVHVSPAVSGQHGHDATLKAANIVVWRMALPEDQAFSLLAEWNQRCDPPWDEAELRRKMVEARKKPVGMYGELRKSNDRAQPATPRSTEPAASLDEGPAPEIQDRGAHAGGQWRDQSVFRNGDEICNAIVVKAEKEKHVEPVPMPEIIRRIRDKTNDWPRRVGAVLFVHEGDEIGFIEKSPGLMGYVGGACGQPPRFLNDPNCHTKAEVFEEYRRTATAYQAVSRFPHEPPIDGCYYACQTPEPGDGACLRELVSRFNPETEIDRDLIMTLFATPLWGGRGGTRPAFCITSDDGRGVGKTTLVNTVGYLYGGTLEITTGEDAGRIKTRLLSPEGLLKRVVLLDNAKSRCLSWADLEGLITAPSISGHRLFTGEMVRPNDITWVITMNGGSYSTDLAQRTVFIKLLKPKYSGTWEESLREFIDANRQKLFADLVGFLRSPPFELKKYTRWGAWERDVLSRVPEPSEAQRVILERQAVADVELEESEIIESYFRNQISELGYMADFVRVMIPSHIARDWLIAATGEKLTTIAASRSLAQFIDEGKLRHIQRNSSRAHGRSLLWTGENWNPEDPIRHDLEEKLEQKRSPGGWN